LDEIIPDRDVGVISDESVRQVVFVGQVTVVTQVKVVTLSTLPAKPSQTVHTTYVTRDGFVSHT